MPPRVGSLSAWTTIVCIATSTALVHAQSHHIPGCNDDESYVDAYRCSDWVGWRCRDGFAPVTSPERIALLVSSCPVSCDDVSRQMPSTSRACAQRTIFICCHTLSSSSSLTERECVCALDRR